MSLYADDDFLHTIAHQAQVGYATQRLNICRDALHHWQKRAALDIDAAYDKRVEHEVTYYTQQIERWQAYLERLGEESNVVISAGALMELNVSQIG
jgi:hypothetical protein